MIKLTANDIRYFPLAQSWDDEARGYLAFHAARYAVLFAHIDKALSGDSSKTTWRILDVGPGPQTSLLRDCLSEGIIDSLGYADPRHPCRDRDRHYPMDLNRADDPSAWPACGTYDFILLAEVIEHLTIAPQHVFRGLRDRLGRTGRLLVQTPNACALPKRIRMLRGQNPFEMIREIGHNPGHFREYTAAELLLLGHECGLSAERVTYANYFAQKTMMGRWFQRCEKLMPPAWRYGITIVFNREVK